MFNKLFSLGVGLVLLVGVAFYRPISATSSASKIDPTLLQKAQEGPTPFLVMLKSQADVSAAAQLPTKNEKGTYVYETLSQHAEQDQVELRTLLDQLGVPYQSFWIANMIWVDGDAQTALAIAQSEKVEQIYDAPTIRSALPQPEANSRSTQGIEWNINKIRAPEVWAMGITGEGVVIAGQDTGYDWDHPLLKAQYRGWDGSSADHNYNWHDAVHSNNAQTTDGNSCGFDSAEPCDDNGHGTHTMGTMIGSDLAMTDPTWPSGATNATGVAPGAKWISCRNMETGAGTAALYSECFQWFVAPTDSNGENPDPSKAPDVINNSWACPPAEGCSSPDIMQRVLENVRAAGIISVVSAGNEGVGCGTVRNPPSLYDASFSVGSTTFDDTISSFSSRGPVSADGSQRLKPDISAPGSGIRSASIGGGFASLSGTSMAAPHVAGLVALLISADPSLSGQVDRIENIIRNSALHLTNSEKCGDFLGTNYPNHVFGAGRIDALKAVELALDLRSGFVATTTVSTDGSCGSAEEIDLVKIGDVTYCHTLQNTTQVTITTATLNSTTGLSQTFTTTIPPGATVQITETVSVSMSKVVSVSWKTVTDQFFPIETQIGSQGIANVVIPTGVPPTEVPPTQLPPTEVPPTEQPIAEIKIYLPILAHE